MRQRIRQFLHAGRRPSRADLALARAWMEGSLFELFISQHPRDIVHGVATARWLIEHGRGCPDLVIAGFVHDVGKGHQRRFDRVVYVITARMGVDRFVASERSRFALRGAVARSRRHADRGADLLEAVGAPERVIALTRRHHAPAGDDGMLVLLQRADSLS